MTLDTKVVEAPRVPEAKVDLRSRIETKVIKSTPTTEHKDAKLVTGKRAVDQE